MPNVGQGKRQAGRLTVMQGTFWRTAYEDEAPGAVPPATGRGTDCRRPSLQQPFLGRNCLQIGGALPA